MSSSFKIPFLLFTLLPLSCLFDSPIVTRPEVKPLAKFHGRTTLDVERVDFFKFQHLGNPRIVLVWSFIGVEIQISTYHLGSVATKLPWDFSGEIMLPPPEDVILSDEVAIGHLWMYHDENDNGTFDNWYHPGVMALLEVLEEKKSAYKTAFRNFLQSVEKKEKPENFTESYFITENGSIAADFGGQVFPIFNPDDYGLDSLFWKDAALYRMELLHHPGKWESFFSSRHSDVRQERYTVKTSDRFAHEIELNYPRRLFPKIGEDLIFEMNIQDVLLKKFELYQAFEQLWQEADSMGFLEYPFNHLDGRDWISGKSSDTYILYFPTRESILEINEAYRHSSFIVEGLLTVQTGYNLMRCTDEYVCSIIPWTDSINIELGSEYEHFNPPSDHHRDMFIDSPRVMELPDLAGFRGRYEVAASLNITIDTGDGGLWVNYPKRGLLFMKPASETVFFNDFLNAQIVFVMEDNGNIMKLIYVEYGHKANAVRLDGKVPNSLIQLIDSFKKRTLVPISAEEFIGKTGKYTGISRLLTVTVNEDGFIELCRETWNPILLYRQDTTFTTAGSTMKFIFSWTQDSVAQLLIDFPVDDYLYTWSGE